MIFYGCASIPFNWKLLIFVIIWWLIKNLFIYIECIGLARRADRGRRRKRNKTFGSAAIILAAAIVVIVVVVDVVRTFSSFVVPTLNVLCDGKRLYLPSIASSASSVHGISYMCASKRTFSSSNLFRFYLHSMPDAHSHQVTHKMETMCFTNAPISASAT